MPKLIFNKLVRDGIINKIEKNNEYATFEKLDEKAFKAVLDKKLLEELSEVLKANDKEQLTEELGDLFEVILTKASLYGITYDDIEQARIQKLEKYGGFNNRTFLIHTVDKEYVDANKGCETCVNKNCVMPEDEMEVESSGILCVNYESPIKK